jgi:hypothetical protein
MEKYDVFISYNSENRVWVEKNLYLPLCSCTTKAGDRKPKIFFDRDRNDGIPVGADFIGVLTTALTNSRKIVPVFSWMYFEKDYCIWEFNTALGRHIENGCRILSPVLLEKCEKMPNTALNVQAVTPNDPEWFERLCDALELRPGNAQCSLEFLNQPRDIQVNRTLPALRVRIRNAAGNTLTGDEETLSVSAEAGELNGPTKIETARGIATFNDLSLPTPGKRLRLVVAGEGYETIRSEFFEVLAPTSELRGPAAQAALPPPEITRTGEATFFANNRTLFVRQNQDPLIFTDTGQAVPLPAAPKLTSRLNLQRTAGDYLALADWHGNVYLFARYGKLARFNLAVDKRPVNVVSDIFINSENIYVGLWSGEVHRLSISGTEELMFVHPAGVQALAVCDQRVYVADFAGKLSVYDRGKCLGTVELEPRVWLLKPSGNILNVIGVDRLYQFPLDLTDKVDEASPLAGVIAAFGDTEMPLIVDAQGSARRLDGALGIRGVFHVVPGAVPVSADDQGVYCVFRNPDGTYCLSAGNNVVYSHDGGSLSVSRDGTLLAVGQHDGIRLVNPAELASSA